MFELVGLIRTGGDLFFALEDLATCPPLQRYRVNMKKKKSAALMDAVVSSRNGINIAARINEAIGTGFLKDK